MNVPRLGSEGAGGAEVLLEPGRVELVPGDDGSLHVEGGDLPHPVVEPHHDLGRLGMLLDVDLLVRDPALSEEPLRVLAVSAPRGGVDDDLFRDGVPPFPPAFPMDYSFCDSKGGSGLCFLRSPAGGILSRWNLTMYSTASSGRSVRLNRVRSSGEIEGFVRRRLDHPTPPEGYLAQLSAAVTHDASSRLENVRARTLVITGDADRLVNWENSLRLAGRIPGAKLVVLPGAPHRLFAETADAFNLEVLQFLNPAG